MITTNDVSKAWNEYYRYREDNFDGPGNGCDDYRDIPAEIINKLRLLEDTARKLQKEYDKQQGYVDNDVFKFRISLDSKFTNDEITIYTKPLDVNIELKLLDNEWFEKNKNNIDESIDSQMKAQKDLVQEKYFTQKKIDELKLKFIQRIQECKNPFNICCVDRDGGYNVTKEQLFNLD